MSDDWSWKTGTPRERAEMVRMHANMKKNRPSDEYLRQIFQLTQPGLVAIINGDDWRPEHSS